MKNNTKTTNGKSERAEYLWKNTQKYAEFLKEHFNLSETESRFVTIAMANQLILGLIATAHEQIAANKKNKIPKKMLKQLNNFENELHSIGMQYYNFIKKDEKIEEK